MSATNALNTAIYSQLSGGTALVAALGGTALYYAQAPDNARPPYIVWDWNAGGDDNMTASRTKDVTAFVRAYAATPAQAGSIDALMDARLNDVTLSPSGWANFWTRRTADFAGVDTDNANRRVYYSGGNYRFRIERT
jgi:hypothetical protein